MELITLAYEDALAQIKAEPKVLVLLERPDEPLCLRFRRAFGSWLPKFERLGYQVFTVHVDEQSSEHEELAAAYIPQLRFFNGGELVEKVVGLRSDAEMRELVAELP